MFFAKICINVVNQILISFKKNIKYLDHFDIILDVNKEIWSF